MNITSHKFLTSALEQLMEFCKRVRESAGDETVSAEAETQLNILNNLAGVVEHFFIREGRDAGIDGPYDAEIYRKPTLQSCQFTSTPTFIIGSRRSGTTLLAYLLNASKNIFALPENWLAGTIAENDSMIAVGRSLKRQLQEPFPRYLWRLARMCDEIYSEVAHANSKTRWVSKELFIPHRLDILDAMFDYRAQYLYAVRHGFDVAHSCCERFMVRDGVPFHHATSLGVETYLREWIANNESTKDFYDRNRDRCIMVRYEDFVERPAHYGRRIFEFLGEEWDDGVLDRLGDQDLVGMGDNKILSLKGNIVRSESKWVSWPQELISTLGRLANPTLKRLGYETVSVNDDLELIA